MDKKIKLQMSIISILLGIAGLLTMAMASNWGVALGVFIFGWSLSIDNAIRRISQ